MKWKEVFRRAFLHLLLISLSLMVLLPILYVFFGSFKAPGQLYSYPPTLLPQNWVVSNFVRAWHSAPFGKWLFNSSAAASLNLLGEVTFVTLSAFALARLKPWGNKYIFAVLMAGLLIPPQAKLVPRYFIIHDLGLLNTIPALFLPFLSRPIGVFLLYNHFKTIPQELEDAATMDGAGPLRFLFSVALPISKAPLSAAAILSFVGSWNRYMWPLIVMREQTQFTAPVGLRKFITQTEGTDFGIMMAGAVIVIAPTVILFIFTQRHFVRALARRTIK